MLYARKIYDSFVGIKCIEYKAQEKYISDPYLLISTNHMFFLFHISLDSSNKMILRHLNYFHEETQGLLLRIIGLEYSMMYMSVTNTKTYTVLTATSILDGTSFMYG